MSKTCYEHLDGKTGWFDPEECAHKFEGVIHGPHSHQLREFVYRTPDGIWINSAWSLDGPWMHSGHRFSFWQITLDKVAEWFPQNYLQPPDILVEDFERESKQGNRSPRSNQAGPPDNPDTTKIQSEARTEERQSSSDLTARLGTAPNRIPSAEELASITAALQALLATFAKYKLFLENPSGPIDDAIPEYAMLKTLCRLEKLLNPRRLAFGSPELASHAIRDWPYEVMTAYLKLRKHVYRIVQRWDVTEICQDRPLVKGRFRVTQDNGTIEEIDRPPKPHTLTQIECDELAWILNACLGALRGTIAPASATATHREGHQAVTSPSPESVNVAVTTGAGPQAASGEKNVTVRDQVFISYSHRDRRFVDELLTQLKPYLRQGQFRGWSDKQIEPGSIWFDEIKAALARTSVAVLLVSPDFLDSDFIHDRELEPLLKEAAAGGVTVLWVLIRDCAYLETPLKDYQAVLSPPGKPFASMTPAKRDTAFRKVCEAIQRTVNRRASRSSEAAGTASRSSRELARTDRKGQEPSGSTGTLRATWADTARSTPIVQQSKVIFPLHGIRTRAAWQKGLSDLAGRHGWVCRLDRWSFGRFSLPAFLTPWTREAKLNWFRKQYDKELHDRRLDIDQGQTPSVVAHSFGTYILGYALLRFDFIRFNKVILCGSILPEDFPWDKLIERGQVQAVRNEYGFRDPWVKRVHCFVRGTGPSGASGFKCQHSRLEQEGFEYDHGDYFGIDHMEDRWIPFLNKPLAEIPGAKSGLTIVRPDTSAPWCLYCLVAIVIVVALILSLCAIVNWRPDQDLGREPPTRSKDILGQMADCIARYFDNPVPKDLGSVPNPHHLEYRLRQAVFRALPDSRSDDNLIKQALDSLHARGHFPQGGGVNIEGLKADLVSLRRARLTWLETKVIPAIRGPRVVTELPLPAEARIVFGADSDQKSTVPVGDRSATEQEIGQLKEYFAKLIRSPGA